MQIYNEYLRVKNRQAKRGQWLGKSPVYEARLELIKNHALELKRTMTYSGKELMMLDIIINDVLQYPVTNIILK